MKARAATVQLFNSQQLSAKRIPLLFSTLRTNSTANYAPVHIVFGDNHRDPDTWVTLDALAPELKAMNYNEILFELEHSEGWDGILEYIKTEQQAYHEVDGKMQAYSLDIHNKKDVAQYIKIMEKGYREIDDDLQLGKLSTLEHLIEWRKLDRRVKLVKSVIGFHADTKALSTFAENAKQLGFDASSIDLQDDVCAASSDKKIKATLDERSIAMAEAILSAEKNSIAIVGLRHLPKIQEIIAEKCAHTNPPILFLNIYPESREADSYERKVRRGDIHHPLGLHCITGSNATEQTRQAILQSIKDCQTLPDKVTETVIRRLT